MKNNILVNNNNSRLVNNNNKNNVDEQGNNDSRPIIYRHIYLKTSAQKCYQRIKKRNRHQEQNI